MKGMCGRHVVGKGLKKGLACIGVGVCRPTCISREGLSGRRQGQALSPSHGWARQKASHTTPKWRAGGPIIPAAGATLDPPAKEDRNRQRLGAIVVVCPLPAAECALAATRSSFKSPVGSRPSACEHVGWSHRGRGCVGVVARACSLCKRKTVCRAGAGSERVLASLSVLALRGACVPPAGAHHLVLVRARITERPAATCQARMGVRGAGRAIEGSGPG